MMRIKAIETALIGAIKDARRGAPHRLVTVVVPNVVAGLQWRRRVARASGALFNVRWIDINQFAQEAITRAGAGLKPATQGLQVAAAWKVLQQALPEYRLYQNSPEMPAQMVRAFDTIDALESEERESIPPAVREMFAEYSEALGGVDRVVQVLEKASLLSESFDFLSEEAYVFLSSDSLSTPHRRFATALGGRVRTIAADFGELPPVGSMALHDEMDEVQWVIAQIQDAALEISIPVHEMAVVLPGRNPYGKLFESCAGEAGLNWNGLGIQTLGETAPGQALEAFVVPDGLSWPEMTSELSKQIDSSGVVPQMLKDAFESWSEIGAIVPMAARSLVLSLLHGLLLKPVPCSRGFGDGVFVGTHRHLEGLSFERIFLLGFSDSSYPPKSRPIALLPVGIGVPSVADQKRVLLGHLKRSDWIVFSYSRSDRRAGREAFPSPWLEEFAGAKTPSIASSMQLLAECGPRSDSSAAMAAGLRDGLPEAMFTATLAHWNTGDIDGEAGVGKSLLPITPLSPTQIETFLKCPRKWYFKYIVDLKEPEVRPPFGLSPAEVGTVVHVTLAQLFETFKADLAEPGYRWTQVHSNWVSDSLLARAELIKGEKLLRFEEDDIRRWARRLDRVLEYDSQYRGDHGAVPILLEKPLNGTIQGLSFYGKADRIDRLRDGSLSIIDYKLGKNKSGAPFELTSAKLAQNPTAYGSTLQGLIYAELARQDSVIGKGSAYNAGYWFLGREPEKMAATQPLDESARFCLQEAVSAVTGMLVEGLVPMTPEKEGLSGLCGYCPYSQICPGERAAIANRQKARANGAYLKFLDLKAGGAAEPEADFV